MVFMFVSERSCYRGDITVYVYEYVDGGTEVGAASTCTHACSDT